MSTQGKTECMLLFFAAPTGTRGCRKEEIQEVVKQMYAWLDRLTEQGKAKAGKPLFPKVKIVSIQKGGSVAGGLFNDSKRGGRRILFARWREPRGGGGDR